MNGQNSRTARMVPPRFSKGRFSKSAITAGHWCLFAMATIIAKGKARMSIFTRRIPAFVAFGCAIIWALGAASQAKAQALPSINGQYQGVVGTAPYLSQELQFCQQSISTAVAIGCSGTVPAGARVVYITPETAAIRCRGDGSAPTATVGYPVAIGQQLQYAGNSSGAQLGNLQCIAQTGTATVDLWFFK